MSTDCCLNKTPTVNHSRLRPTRHYLAGNPPIRTVISRHGKQDMVVMLADYDPPPRYCPMIEVEARYKGVKGWLLLLCINLAVLDPLAMLLNLFLVTNVTKPQFDGHPELLRLILINGACSIGLAVFSIYAGVMLWKALPAGLGLTRKYLFTGCFYSIFSLILPSLAGIPADLQSQILGGSILNSMVTILYLCAWYQYLKRSKRVRATFGP
jgi:hypothetical protein